ncbi:dihydroxyacetone kinase-like protein [Streptomyces albogriseolus]
MLDADFFRRWMTVTAASVDREAERLTALDSEIGDADHGSNLQRGFRAVKDALEKEPPATPGAVLTQAGRLLVSTVGGASGPLYGTLLRRTGKTLGEAAEVDRQQFAEALRAGVDAVMKLGGAAAGDKTMIDALLPAVDALGESFAGGAGRRAGGRGRDDADAGPQGQGELSRRAQHRAPGPRRHLVGAADLRAAGRRTRRRGSGRR